MSSGALQSVFAVVLFGALLVGGLWGARPEKMQFGVPGGFVEVVYPRVEPERVALTLEFDAYQGSITIAPGALVVFDRALRLAYPSTRQRPFVVPGKTHATEVFDFDVRAANGNVSRELDVILHGETIALRLKRVDASATPRGAEGD